MTIDPIACAEQLVIAPVSGRRGGRATVSAAEFSAAVGERYLRHGAARRLVRRSLVVVNATTLHDAGHLIVSRDRAGSRPDERSSDRRHASAQGARTFRVSQRPSRIASGVHSGRQKNCRQMVRFESERIPCS